MNAPTATVATTTAMMMPPKSLLSSKAAMTTSGPICRQDNAVMASPIPDAALRHALLAEQHAQQTASAPWAIRQTVAEQVPMASRFPILPTREQVGDGA